ncbi:hypothetical protein [Argonema antarcticum]|uniref:hypothetical protein n=1 Tax=Argonema antarcticum TaxID=2942763 RepID=UPI0020139EDD|nr:hypothetical protein [Argonema antarcticum]MCL1470645.1 hypothetical protein [Argonema antarcticum A004/B2]
MSEDKELQQQDDSPPLKEIKFNYIKSNLFRVVRVDGIWAGITPNLDINVNLCSERYPIPQQTLHKIDPDGSIGEEIIDERISRDGIVREVEVGAVMDISTAKSLIELLQELIEQVEKVTENEEPE